LPSQVTVSNNVLNYTFSGSGWISGSTGLTKQGTAGLIMDNAGTPNDFDGIISISNGVLQIGNGDAQGNLGSGPIVDNGTLIYDRTDKQTLSNQISGTGSMSVATNGTVVLAGANTFTGPLTISYGTVVADNNSALGATNNNPVIVNSGGRLDLAPLTSRPTR